MRIPLRHEGEVDWRHFRHSLAQALPYRWRSAEDTSFRLATFHKNAKKTRSGGKFHQETTGLKLDLDINSMLSPTQATQGLEGNVVVSFLHDSIEVLQVVFFFFLFFSFHFFFSFPFLLRSSQSPN